MFFFILYNDFQGLSSSSAPLNPKYFQKSTLSLNNYKVENKTASNSLSNHQQSNDFECLKSAKEIIEKQKHMYILVLSHTSKLENVCMSQEIHIKNLISEIEYQKNSNNQVY